MSDKSKINPSKPRKLRDVTHWDRETDVAIVGFGGAGGCAAIEAADAGSSVTIFEVASDNGGSTAMSSAEIYMGGSGGTRVQQACGFEDSTEDMISYMMMSAGPQADEEKIRNYCEKISSSGMNKLDKHIPFKDSLIDGWIRDKPFFNSYLEKAYPFAQQAKPCPRGHNLHVEGDNGGPLFMKIVAENVERREAITVAYETRALTLIIDDDDSVVGLVIRQNQQELNVRAHQGVILCAGGFVMNEEMIRKYAPMLTAGNTPIGNPGDTGTGIMMGMSVGGAAINMHEGFITLPYYPPASMTKGIVINDQGQRFINEDVYHGRLGAFVVRQQSERVYFILSVEQYGDYERVSYMGSAVAGTGETVQELEEELELREGTLQQTINVYNEDCVNGKDTQCHKAAEWLEPLKPPLVALDITPGRGSFLPFFTLGGLDTLPTGEVVDPQRDVIAGLYAAGRTACGVVRRAEGYSSGMSVGDASFSGRLAGKQAAARERA